MPEPPEETPEAVKPLRIIDVNKLAARLFESGPPDLRDLPPPADRVAPFPLEPPAEE
jgi:hypothetical protein